MTNWNIPKTFTQGDRITWIEQLHDYNPATDTLSCFIRGQSALNITGTPRDGSWEFVIDSTNSKALAPGKYKTQFVVYKNGTDKTTLSTTDLVVRPSFEKLTELETLTDDEIELELITKAIAKLVTGAVSEYRVGDRMMRYQDLEQLTKRQRELRLRVKYAKNPYRTGRSVPIRFSDY